MKENTGRRTLLSPYIFMSIFENGENHKLWTSKSSEPESMGDKSSVVKILIG